MTMGLDASVTDRRRQTRNHIYRYLYDAKGFCSRQRLARDLGLSLPTVYQNLSELMAAGLIRDSGEQQPTGGRKASGLSIVPDARVAVGVSVTEHHLRLAAADLLLNELAYQEVDNGPIPRFNDMGGLLSQVLEEFLDRFSIDRNRLLGVGIALPAVMSPDSRVITAGPTLRLKDTSLADLTASIPYPAHVENDATGGGHAEAFAHSGSRNMAYLSWENGVGGAVVLGGRPYLGDNRRSGEFGHICVEPGGLRCACGRNGCLEAYCSPRRIREAFGLSPEEFFRRLEEDGPGRGAYAALWDNMLRHLAVGVCNLRMTLDCDVVIGGLMSEFLEPYLPRLREYAAGGNPFEQSADYVHLSAMRRHTVPLGVALHFIADFLEHI